MADLQMTRGDSKTLNLRVTLGGTPLPLAGYTVWFTAKQNLASADTDPLVIQKKTGGAGIEIADDKATIVISPTDTASLPDKPCVLFYDVQLKSPTGEVSTVLRGALRVEPDVTKATT